jgi:hypothetical protein
MRHFLIITCLAALTCAAAPVQVALAQADSPAVESEVEPLPKFDEPDSDGAISSGEDDSKDRSARNESKLDPSSGGACLFDWFPNNLREVPNAFFMWLGGGDARQGTLENGALGNSLSDPLTILRFVVTPFAFWLLKNLISYSFLRIHVLRSLYADIEYRLRFTHTCIMNTERWLRATSGRMNRAVPFLGTAKEEHIVYPTMQSDIRECLWGREVTALRILYRGLDEIEVRLGKIENCFSQMIAHSRRMDEANVLPHVHDQMMRRYRSEIQENLSQVKAIYGFWKKVGLRSYRRKFSISAYCRRFLLQIVSLVATMRVSLGLADKKSVYRHVASSIFVGVWVWHLLWAWGPAVILVLAVFVLFWGPLLSFEHFEVSVGLGALVLLFYSTVGLGAYWWSQRRIRENVLELEDKRWNEQISKEKRTPRDI